MYQFNLRKVIFVLKYSNRTFKVEHPVYWVERVCYAQSRCKLFYRWQLTFTIQQQTSQRCVICKKYCDVNTCKLKIVKKKKLKIKTRIIELCGKDYCYVFYVQISLTHNLMMMVSHYIYSNISDQRSIPFSFTIPKKKSFYHLSFTFVLSTFQCYQTFHLKFFAFFLHIQIRKQF